MLNILVAVWFQLLPILGLVSTSANGHVPKGKSTMTINCTDHHCVLVQHPSLDFHTEDSTFSVVITAMIYLAERCGYFSSLFDEHIAC